MIRPLLQSSLLALPVALATLAPQLTAPASAAAAPAPTGAHVTARELVVLPPEVSVERALVDDTGQVTLVGSRRTAVGSSWVAEAFAWRHGAEVDLGPTVTGMTPGRSAAVAANRRGDVLVTSNYHLPPPNEFAYLVRDGVRSELQHGGNLQANALDEAGVVVGAIRGFGWMCGFGPWQPLVWQSDGSAIYGALPASLPWGEAVALDRNDHGQTVGWSATRRTGEPDPVCSRGVRFHDPHAVLWQAGQVTDLGTLGGTRSSATAINNAGQVLGTSDTASGSERAFLWEAGAMTDLGTLGGTVTPVALGESGHVVGSSATPSGAEHAFVWRAGVMTDVGTLGGPTSRATAVNARGQVVGTSTTVSGQERAFLWDRGVMTELGASGATGASRSLALSDRGEVVGVVDLPTGQRQVVLWTVAGHEAVAEGLRALRAEMTGAGPGRSLVAKADAAVRALEGQRTAEACSALRDLARHLRVHTGRHVPADQGRRWSEQVAGATTQLGCP